MKKWLAVLVTVVVVLMTLGFVKDIFIRGTVQTVGSHVVGAPIKVGHFSSSLVTQKVHLKDFRLYNPPGYPSEPMLDVPEILIDADVGALMKGKLRFPLIVFNLKEVVIIKNEKGDLNVNDLKVARQEPKKGDKKTAETKKAEKKMMPIQIDVMKLNMERVIYRDYSRGGEPSVQVFDLNLKDKEFKDIKSLEQLAGVIMLNALGPVGLQSAGVYAAATVLGVGFLPAGVAGVLLGKDDAVQEFALPVDKVMRRSVEFFKESGRLKSEDPAKGVVKGIIDGVDVTLMIKKGAKGGTEVTATARKLMIPKPEIAGGILYRLSQRLK